MDQEDGVVEASQEGQNEAEATHAMELDTTVHKTDKRTGDASDTDDEQKGQFNKLRNKVTKYEATKGSNRGSLELTQLSATDFSLPSIAAVEKLIQCENLNVGRGDDTLPLSISSDCQNLPSTSEILNRLDEESHSHSLQQHTEHRGDTLQISQGGGIDGTAGLSIKKVTKQRVLSNNTVNSENNIA